MKRISIYGFLIFFGCCIMVIQTAFAFQVENAAILRNQTTSVVSFYYIDKVKTLISITIQAGKEVRVPLEGPIVMYNSIGINREPFYIRPADILNISKDATGSLSFAAGDFIRTNELKLLSDLKVRFDNILTLKDQTGKWEKLRQLKQNRAIYEKYLNDGYQEKLQYLDAFIKVHDIGKEFQHYAANYLFYQMMNDKIDIMPKEKDSINSLSDFKRSLNCDECFNILPYTDLAQKYALRINAVYGEKAFEEITHQFTGETKDFMLMLLMRGYIKIAPLLFETNYATFISETRTSVYQTYIAELKQLEVLNRDFRNSGMLLSQQGDTIRFETLLGNLKDKHVFIDFWASWCVPCIDAIPDTREFEDSSGSVYVIYLSLDKDPNAWKQYSKNLKLRERKNYLVIGNYESALAKKFKIAAIPHYVMISKTRNTVIPFAPAVKDRKFDQVIKGLK